MRDALRVALSSGAGDALSPILGPCDAQRLERFAERLPTVQEGIVEIPLGLARADAGPDFHLMPHAARDRARLAGALHRRAAAGHADKGDATVMAGLIEGWPADAGLVCEYDVGEDATSSLPSLFLNFPAAWAEAQHGVARDLLFRLLPDWAACRAGIDMMSDAAGNGTRVSWIGVMLPRRPRILRVNLAFVRSEQTGSILQGRLPPDRVAAARDALSWAIDAADRAVLAVDLSADGLGADIGLECFVDGEGDDRWAGFLDAAVGRGLVAPNEASAVRSWPGRVTPASRAVAPWPDAWIVDDLLGDGGLPHCARTINHIKVTAKASGRLAVKAYLRFRLDWTAVEGGAEAEGRPDGAAATAFAAVRRNEAARDAVGQAFTAPFPPPLADVAGEAGVALDAQTYRSDWMARRIGGVR